MQALEREAMKLRSEVATKKTECIRMKMSLDRESQAAADEI